MGLDQLWSITEARASLVRIFHSFSVKWEFFFSRRWRICVSLIIVLVLQMQVISTNPKQMNQKMLGYIKLQMRGCPPADTKHWGQFIKVPTSHWGLWNIGHGKCNFGFPCQNSNMDRNFWVLWSYKVWDIIMWFLPSFVMKRSSKY